MTSSNFHQSPDCQFIILIFRVSSFHCFSPSLNANKKMMLLWNCWTKSELETSQMNPGPSCKISMSNSLWQTPSGNPPLLSPTKTPPTVSTISVRKVYLWLRSFPPQSTVKEIMYWLYPRVQSLSNNTPICPKKSTFASVVMLCFSTIPWSQVEFQMAWLESSLKSWLMKTTPAQSIPSLLFQQRMLLMYNDLHNSFTNPNRKYTCARSLTTSPLTASSIATHNIPSKTLSPWPSTKHRAWVSHESLCLWTPLYSASDKPTPHWVMALPSPVCLLHTSIAMPSSLTRMLSKSVNCWSNVGINTSSWGTPEELIPIEISSSLNFPFNYEPIILCTQKTPWSYFQLIDPPTSSNTPSSAIPKWLVYIWNLPQSTRILIRRQLDAGTCYNYRTSCTPHILLIWRRLDAGTRYIVVSS